MSQLKEGAAPQNAAKGEVDVKDAAALAAKDKADETSKSSRRSKAARNKDSFRLGAPSTNESTSETKTLKFIVPSKDGVTSNTEMIAVRDLAVELSKAGSTGIKAVGFYDKAWEIILDLQAAAEEVDKNPDLAKLTDKEKDNLMLNIVHFQLKETANASSVLSNGFDQHARPSWVYLIGDDFVSDSGTF